ncbi:hypothetical protein D9M68_844420 [compost metagenome]
MAARRLPSRSRASMRLLMAVSANDCRPSLSSPGLPCWRVVSCSTSATDRGPAVGSQARTLSCRPTSFWSSRALGERGMASLRPSIQARTSTLPRFRREVSSSRSAGSDPRRSSGSLKVRSRKRLLTERISKPRPGLGSRAGSAFAAVAGPPRWAVA